MLQIASWLSWLPDNNTITFDPKQKVTVFTEVIRGRAPVLNADVTAIIERPQSVPLKVPLYDNGVGKSSVVSVYGVLSLSIEWVGLRLSV